MNIVDFVLRVWHRDTSDGWLLYEQSIERASLGLHPEELQSIFPLDGAEEGRFGDGLKRGRFERLV